MNGVNKQIVVGNLAADAELNHVGEKETPKLTFRVIANTGFGKYAHTEGFNVTLWGRRAETLAPYLKKGRGIYVEGETQTHSWEDAESQRRYRTEVVIAPYKGAITLLGNGKRQPGPEEYPDEEGGPS